MTQVEVARRLGELTGHVLPQASISAMEHGYDGVRRRRFDVHELYLLSVVFEVPVVYFFLPPPADIDRALAGTGRPASDLYRVVLGRDDQLAAIDERCADEGGAAVPGPGGAAPWSDWACDFRAWRSGRLDAAARHCRGDVIDVVDALDTLADFIKEVKAIRREALAEGTAGP